MLPNPHCLASSEFKSAYTAFWVMNYSPYHRPLSQEDDYLTTPLLVSSSPVSADIYPTCTHNIHSLLLTSLTTISHSASLYLELCIGWTNSKKNKNKIKYNITYMMKRNCNINTLTDKRVSFLIFILIVISFSPKKIFLIKQETLTSLFF